MRFFAKWLISMAAVLLVCVLFPNHVYASDVWIAAVAAGTILFAVNLTVRPLAQVIALPISCLTLGVGAILVNTLMVWLVDKMLPFVDFGGFWTTLLVALFVSLGTVLFDSARKG